MLRLLEMMPMGLGAYPPWCSTPTVLLPAWIPPTGELTRSPILGIVYWEGALDSAS
jgi:hypothetical protein